MKRYAVRLEELALLDLDDIADYIAVNDTPARAEHVVSRLHDALSSLATLPNRGNHPAELLALGNRRYREVRFKPYRIIYRVHDDEVVVVLIADGRRDMRGLLTRRLLGA